METSFPMLKCIKPKKNLLSAVDIVVLHNKENIRLSSNIKVIIMLQIMSKMLLSWTNHCKLFIYSVNVFAVALTDQKSLLKCLIKVERNTLDQLKMISPVVIWHFQAKIKTINLNTDSQVNFLNCRISLLMGIMLSRMLL